MDPALRPATSEDYGWIIAGVDEWWGRPVAASLPRLYLDHFCATSLVAECDASHVAFLIGFHSPSDCRASYIHFAGVDPRWLAPIHVGRQGSLGDPMYPDASLTVMCIGGSVKGANRPSRGSTSTVKTYWPGLKCPYTFASDIP